MFSNKKCMRCGEKATHKFVRVEKGGAVDIFLCADHAAQASPWQKAQQQAAPASIGLGEILAQFLGNPQALEALQKAEPGLQCKSCGLPFLAYKKTLFLGCPDCYDSFFQALLPELQRMHRATKHIGRRPGGGKESPVAGALPEPEQKPLIGPPQDWLEGGQMEEVGEEEPVIPHDPEKLIAELTRRMKQAIAEEDFETAARCRDEINKLREDAKQSS